MGNTEVATRSAAALATRSAALQRESKSAATLDAYRRALGKIQAWADAQPLSDGLCAEYLAYLDDKGYAPSTAAQAVAAVKWAAETAGTPSPARRQTAAALAGFRRRAQGRGRGQSSPLTADAAAAIAATARLPRRKGRGMESAATAARRGAVDIALVGLLFHAGMRRAEVAALEWDDVTDAEHTPGALLVRVRRSKTNQTGDTPDVRMVKNGFAAALQSLRGDAAEGRVFGLTPQTINNRVRAAARAAGLQGSITSHSGRIGLATELVIRGASTADVQLAGGWKTGRMVAHYAAGARAELGAVARYL